MKKIIKNRNLLYILVIALLLLGGLIKGNKFITAGASIKGENAKAGMYQKDPGGGGSNRP